MKFIKENNGVYQFQDSNGTKHSVGANSKEEALSILENRPKPNEIDILKRKLLSNVKSEVSKRLSATDYKVIRHRDQQALKVDASLTELEYQALLEERQQYRTRSNQMETEIDSLTTIQELENYKVRF